MRNYSKVKSSLLNLIQEEDEQCLCLSIDFKIFFYNCVIEDWRFCF